MIIMIIMIINGLLILIIKLSTSQNECKVLGIFYLQEFWPLDRAIGTKIGGGSSGQTAPLSARSESPVLTDD
jgi:hypothetical protein